MAYHDTLKPKAHIQCQSWGFVQLLRWLAGQILSSVKAIIVLVPDMQIAVTIGGSFVRGVLPVFVTVVAQCV